MRINPNSTFKYIWDLLVLSVTTYVGIGIPLRIVFDIKIDGLEIWRELFITVIFLLDVVFNFFTSLRIRGKLITDKKSIAKNYLRGWFLPDMLASIPWELIENALGFDNLFLLVLLRVFRLTRLLHLVDVNQYLRRFEETEKINPLAIKAFMFLFTISLSAHWIACGWIGLGETIAPGTDLNALYLEAIYWTVTTLTTVGYGDITPKGTARTVYTMIIMMVGVGVYGYVIGNISTMLTQLNITKNQHQEKLKSITAFMKYKMVPLDIQVKVRDYYDYLWESKLVFKESMVLGELPIALKEEISLYLNRALIEKVPIFTGADNEFITDIALNLNPHVFIPGEYIIRKGRIGHEMFFINQGHVEVVSEDGKTVYATLAPGAYFGEIALLLSTKRTASIRAVDYCDLYSLNKVTFDRILKDYPKFAERVKAESNIRRAELEKDGIEVITIESENESTSNINSPHSPNNIIKPDES